MSRGRLGDQDQLHLARILKIAREIELAWPHPDREEPWAIANDPHHFEQYQTLKNAISACANSEAESLRRLATLSAHLHEAISLAHFYTFTVPFERLSSRSLRDDEFMVLEGDRPIGIAVAAKHVPLKVIVENLRSAFNVGALFRTSECLGISEILLCGYTPGPDDDKTAKTAMGTESLVAWRRVDRARTAFALLRSEGYKIVALETVAGATPLDRFEFASRPTAFVIGNERFGLDGDTLKDVDAICRIPVRGVKNSMNAGVAFGIAAFEWLRQYNDANPKDAGNDFA